MSHQRSDVEPRISVVIPSLGRPSLERAVTSVALQSSPPDEIIIVANGAQRLTDGRLTDLRMMTHPISLRVLSLPPYSGPGISRNLGAWEAESDYVVFLDDDDEFTPNFIEFVKQEISTSNADIYYPAKFRIPAEGQLQKLEQITISAAPKDQWFQLLYKHRNTGFGGELAARRESFFDVGGFPVEFLSSQDRAFAMEALRAGLVIVSIDQAQIFCHRPSGYRASGRSDKWLINLAIMDRYWKDVDWRTRLLSISRWLRGLLRTLIRTNLRVPWSGAKLQ